MKKINLKNHIPKGEIYLFRILEIFIFGFAIYAFFIGNWSIGILTTISLALIFYPQFFTKNRIKHFPIEVEIILFIVILFQLIIGEMGGFYANIPYYDKLTHYMFPFFVGLVGFLIFYTMHETGRVKTSNGIALVFIMMITLGFGALWEIYEYFSDTFLYPNIPNYHHFQGNLVENAHIDTMNDLIVDFLGGIFGCLLGFWFLEKSRFKKGKRIGELTQEVSEDLFEKK